VQQYQGHIMEQPNNLLIHRRLGIYWVGDKPFINKVDGFIESSKSNIPVRWDFNDDVFSSIDWTIPVETSLDELYRQRAQQLRDRYDYISLFFSGGVDSTNALHAFIDNDILLDEIVMFRPKHIETNNSDLSNRNLYGEIDYAAVPHLKEHLKDPRTIVRFIDIDNIANYVLNNEKLVSQIEVSGNLTPTSFLKTSMCMTDPIWNALYQSGKNVCHIQGVDKPHIKVVDGKSHFQFSDMISFNFTPRYHTPESEMIWKHQFHELFYWTPDLPQLVIKQCQIMKHLYDIGLYRYELENTDRVSQEKLEFISNYIYPSHVTYVRNRFAVTKPGYTQNAAGMHDWFFETMPQNIIGEYRYIKEQMVKNINDPFFVSAKSIYAGEPTYPGTERKSLRITKSKKYNL